MFKIIFVFATLYIIQLNCEIVKLLSHNTLVLHRDHGYRKLPASPNLYTCSDTSKPHKTWEEKYKVFNFVVYKHDGHILPYRLYVPLIQGSGKKYPLVLFLHGAGERGTDNRKQLFRFNTPAFWEKYPCFIVAPQCPETSLGETNDENTWVKTPFSSNRHSMELSPTWPMALSIQLLKEIVATYPVDRSRIYVTGLSMGGFGTWEILQRCPVKQFAAAIPICGGADLAFAPKFANIPLWVFHGGVDSTVLTQRSRDVVAAIRLAGGSPIYTEYPNVTHDCWTQTYQDMKVWDWLFAQRRK